MNLIGDWQRVRRLGRYLAHDRKRLVLTVLLLLPVALAGSIQPLLVGQAISVLRGEASLPWLADRSTQEAMRIIVGLLLCAVLLRLGLLGLQTFNIQAVGQRLTSRIRDDLFKHAMALSLRFHDSMQVGVAHPTHQRCGCSRRGLRQRSRRRARRPGQPCGHRRLDAADRMVDRFCCWSPRPVTHRLGCRALPRGQLQRTGGAPNSMPTSRRTSKVWRWFRCSAASRSTAGASKTGLAHRRAVNGTIFFDSSISAFLEWVALGAVALVLALGGWMVTDGTMGLGILTTFILYSQRLFDPLRQLAERFTQIQRGLTAVERIGELMEEPLEILEARDARPLNGAGVGEIIFDDVCFGYRPDEPIPKHLSFPIAPVNMWPWWAPPIRQDHCDPLLCRLYEPQQGRILLDGRESAAFRSPICVGSWGWCCRTPFCSAATSPTT